MTEDAGRQPRDERFEGRARERAPERVRCGHCGHMFEPMFSAAGDRGICQPCLDD